MGFMDKLMFWRKKETDFGNFDIGKDPFASDPFRQSSSKDPFIQQPFNQAQDPFNSSQSPGFNQNIGNDPFQTQTQFTQNSSFQNNQFQKPAQSAQPFGYGSNVGTTQFGSGYAQDQKQQDFFSTKREDPYEMPKDNRDTQKEIEIISVKLDSIRTTLEAINQRLSNLERASYDKDWKNKGW